MKKLPLLIICIFWSTLSFSQKWEEVASSNDCVIEVDLASIKREGGLIYVWSKWAYTDPKAKAEYVNKEVDRLRSDASVTFDRLKKWEHYDHTLNYDVFDSKSQKRKPLHSVDYSKNGEPLDSYEFKYSEYSLLIPGSVGMDVLDFLTTMRIYEVEGRWVRVYVEKVEEFLSLYPNAKYLCREKEVEPKSIPLSSGLNGNALPELEYVIVENFCLFKLPKSLEVRKDGSLIDRGTRKLHEIRGWAYDGSRVTLQPIGANEMKRSAFSIYGRILIFKEEADGICAIDDFTKEEIEVVKYMLIEQLKDNAKQAGMNIIDHSEVTIRTISGKQAFRFAYIRDSSKNGNTPVFVEVYRILEKGRAIEITMSYRQSEKSLWENDFKTFLTSFKTI